MASLSVRFLFSWSAAAALTLFSTSPAKAATPHWNVVGPADWFDPSKWNPLVLPTNADTVYIDNGGTVTVTNSGSAAAASSITIGSISGSGTMNIDPSASLSTTTGTIGNRSTGVVNVSGTWNNSDAFWIGGYYNGGNGTLNILNGGNVTAAYTRLGTNGYGTLNVAAGGTFTNPGVFNIGFNGPGYTNGSGTLTINGGTVTSPGASIGTGTGSSATINSGTWNANYSGQGYMLVGTETTGSLTINGGTVSNYTGVVGNGGAGTATVTGGSWNNAAYLYVGGYYYFGYYYTGTGTMTVNGGAVSAYASYLAYGGSAGTATVTGGTWTNTTDFQVGVTGTGLLVLSNTGTVAITGGSRTMTLGVQAGSTGTLQIGNGDAFTGALNVTTVTKGSGAGAVVFKQTNSYTMSPTLTGGLSVEQAGTGTTTLNKTNTYSGETTVTGGKLLANAAAATGSGAVTVKIGGTLGGTGSVSGLLTVEAGGTLEPGSSTFAANGGISLLDNAKISLRLGTASDRITDNGALTLGQNVRLTLSPVAGFGVGHYTLISFTGSLTDNSNGFAGWTIAGLPGAYAAQFETIGNTIQLNVTVVPEPVTGMTLAVGALVCLVGLRHRRGLRPLGC